ncbi:MAG: hypothetical protein R3E97_06615 [Candidatus Eisenbacteria bacterium]
MSAPKSKIRPNAVGQFAWTLLLGALCFGRSATAAPEEPVPPRVAESLPIVGSLLPAEPPQFAEPLQLAESLPPGSLDEDEPAAAPTDDPFGGDSPFGADDPFGTDDPFGMETTDWDSVFAAVDDDFDRASGRYSPIIDLTYDKVAGFHVAGGVTVGPVWERRIRTESRIGYDFGRSKPTGQGSLRAGELDKESWWTQIGAHSGIVPFGSHQPYGNPIFAIVGGYDARSYVREEAGELRLSWKPYKTWTLQTAVRRVHQAPSPITSTEHIFGSDRWMDQNAEARRWTGTGVELHVSHRPRYSEDVVLPGTYLSGTFANFGGALSSGPEFTHGSVSAKQIWLPRGKDELYVIADLGLTGGDAPPQFAQDLGGHGGLRGFEPRFVTGTQRLFVRAQFAWANDKVGKIKTPIFGKTKLRFVPFVEAGSVWGDSPIHDAGDMEMPGGNQVHWDLGVGLRRNVDSSGLLSYLQVDFAWPMGADTGPARITLTLSSRGFD